MGGQEGLLLPSASVADGAENGYALAVRHEMSNSDRAYGGGLGTEQAVDAAEPVIEDVRDLPKPATPETIPARNRFKAWSRRYVTLLACIDGAIAAAAVLVPAAFSDTLRQWPYALPVLAVIGMLVWPAAIAFRHGYRRGQIGIGIDELRAVWRAGMVVVVASALPAGFIGNSLNDEFTFYALLKLVVVAVPLAVLLSLAARAVVRQMLPRLQDQGRGIRNVVVVGSFEARPTAQRAHRGRSRAACAWSGCACRRPSCPDR